MAHIRHLVSRSALHCHPNAAAAAAAEATRARIVRNAREALLWRRCPFKAARFDTRPTIARGDNMLGFVLCMRHNTRRELSHVQAKATREPLKRIRFAHATQSASARVQVSYAR